MRLIIGVHNFPMEIVDATLQKEYLNKEINEVRKEISKNLQTLSDALEKKQLATLAWMISDGFLEVKAASVKGEGSGIFHAKTLVFTDENENEVVAVGSPNETRNGLGGNYEQVLVLKSWESPEGVNDLKQSFIDLWDDNVEEAVVSDISEDTAKMIIDALGDEYNNVANQYRNDKVNDVINQMSKMPTNFFVSGEIPALFPHQERAVIDALSRWPIRVLFADEVGLGKTFEAAATLVFLVKYCNVKRVIILTPKSVLQQWQDELYTNFGLEVWLYDSSSKAYISPNMKRKSMGNRNPIGVGSPDLILMSAQYARGSKGSKNIFEREDALLPELLVVDEAHSARISTDLADKKKKTLMYKMLEKINSKIPHMILATATPMLKSAEEYHAILKLLGLPKAWQKEIYYNLSLKLINSNSIPDTSDANSAAALLMKTLESMNPNCKRLDQLELSILSTLKEKYYINDKSDISDFVKTNWIAFKKIFIKLHPAHLLTVRNTRRALTDIGYKFPERVLRDVDINNSDRIELFYDKVNAYLSKECFSIERARDPEKRINIGFMKVNYQQRVASSLYSCSKSLNRRYEKAMEIYKQLNDLRSFSDDTGTIFDLNSFMDDQDFEESENNEEELILGYQNQEIDVNELKLAASIESATLGGLINQCNELIKTEGDKKIETSINIALGQLDEDVSVLLFSRYTDTIDALISEFRRVKADSQYTYGIYTGDRSVVISNGVKEKCDKNQIKDALFSRKLKILFCSDAASEGLNLQAARVLINVDVPWTPARLEQRIGRIARLGQTADKVYIHNVWYPNSIEAKMYRRIQQRLKSTNIAIGEFPEIIADNIKNVVLNNADEDTSLIDLRNIRNSYQTQALEQLWLNDGSMETFSEKIRNQLMKLCDDSFECVDQLLEDNIKQFKTDDKKLFKLTATSGLAETISLTSYPWKLIDYSLIGVKKCFDPMGNVSSFSNDDISGYIRHDEILNTIINDSIEDRSIGNDYPIMLPDMSALDMSFAVDEKDNKIPKFWPFVKEEKYEN